MRNGKSHIKISFRLRFFVREWRCGCDFPSDSLLSKSFFWFWTKNYLEFRSAKSPLPCIFASTIEIVATPSHRLLPPALSKITQGNLFREWFLRWWARLIWIWSRLSAWENQFLHRSCPPAIGFQNHRKPPQSLIWDVNHKVTLLFSSVRSRAAVNFNSNLTAWGKYFGVSSPFATRLFALASIILWKFAKDFALPKMDFRYWTTRLSQARKQFFTIEPTRIHTRDGRTHNGNLRYTIRPIEDAIHYFYERQGLRH